MCPRLPKEIKWSHLEESHRSGLFEIQNQVVAWEIDNENLLVCNTSQFIWVIEAVLDWIVPPSPKKELMSTQNKITWDVILFGNSSLQIQLVKMNSHWSEAGSSPRTSILVRRQCEDTEEGTHREVHMWTVAETTVLCPQVKEHQGLPTTTRNEEEAKNYPFLETSMECGPLSTLILDF